MNTLIQKKYFDQSENQFDHLEIQKPLLSQILEMNSLISNLPDIKSKKILDFGSGSGRVSIYFLSKGISVYAYDISNNSLHNLHKYYLSHHRKNWGKLTLIKKIPKSFKVDIVVGADVLHHVNIASELKTIYRILKPNGSAIFSEPNPLNVFWYIYHVTNGTPWHIESGILNCYRPKLIHDFKLAGFSKTVISPHGWFPTRIFNFNRFLCRLNTILLPKLFPINYFSYRQIILSIK